MKVGEIILNMIHALSRAALEAYAGRHEEAVRRVEEVWTVNRTALVKAAADAAAEAELGEE